MKNLAAIAIITAFCSMTFELLLAQSLATTLGSTQLRFGITVGLYLASLGIGSFFVGAIGRSQARRRLISIEWALTLIGGAAPLMTLIADYLSRVIGSHSDHSLVSLTSQAIGLGLPHLVIIIIGLLSGMEIPLILAMAENENQANRLLAIDYLGTMLASVVFPLFLLPNLGIFEIGFLTAALNSTVIACLQWSEEKSVSMVRRVTPFIAILLAFYGVRSGEQLTLAIVEFLFL